MRNLLMLIGLAIVFAGGTACFVMPPSKAPPAETDVEACAGLAGEAKRRCEQREAQ